MTCGTCKHFTDDGTRDVNRCRAEFPKDVVSSLPFSWQKTLVPLMKRSTGIIVGRYEGEGCPGWRPKVDADLPRMKGDLDVLKNMLEDLDGLIDSGGFAEIPYVDRSLLFHHRDCLESAVSAMSSRISRMEERA